MNIYLSVRCKEKYVLIQNILGARTYVNTIYEVPIFTNVKSNWFSLTAGFIIATVLTEKLELVYISPIDMRERAKQN